jgi:predicted alpha/beta-hydrolase family hydrolase
MYSIAGPENDAMSRSRNNRYRVVIPNRLRHRLAALVALVVFWAAPAVCSDFEREQRLGEEMILNLFEGEVVTLNDGERDFLSAYIEVPDPRGIIVLLHGRGFHPDWPDVVGPVRALLAEAGWSTLSLQMPVLEPKAKYYDYVKIFPEADKRIDAGIRYARDRVDGPLVLFAHSCGAHMAMHWFEESKNRSIDALVVAGLGATDYGQDLVEPFPLEQIHVPMLDVLGSREYERVLAMAPGRAQALAGEGHPYSSQVFVKDADHYFKGKNADLARVVIEWLDQLPRE